MEHPKKGDEITLLDDAIMEFGGPEGPYRVLKTYRRRGSLWVKAQFTGDTRPGFAYTPMRCTEECIATINGQDSPWC